MANQPKILQPRQPLLDTQVFDGTRRITPGVDGSWWRFFDRLANLSGSLLNGLVIPPNAFFQAADISSGGTIEPFANPPRTILGNSSAEAAAASPQTVDATLSFENGVLGAGKIGPGQLSGNPTGGSAAPVGINVGANMSLDGNTLNANGGGGSGGSLALAESVAYWGM